jgi:hypothetical protein
MKEAYLGWLTAFGPPDDSMRDPTLETSMPTPGPRLSVSATLRSVHRADMWSPLVCCSIAPALGPGLTLWSQAHSTDSQTRDSVLLARRPPPCMPRTIRRLWDSVVVRLDLGIWPPWTPRGSSCLLPAQKPHVVEPSLPSVRGRGKRRGRNLDWPSSALLVWTGRLLVADWKTVAPAPPGISHWCRGNCSSWFCPASDLCHLVGRRTLTANQGNSSTPLFALLLASCSADQFGDVGLAAQNGDARPWSPPWVWAAPPCTCAQLG